jgi:hypothetical protein
MRVAGVADIPLAAFHRIVRIFTGDQMTNCVGRSLAVVSVTVAICGVATALPTDEYPDHVRLLTTRAADGLERAIATPAEWAARRHQILNAMALVLGPLPSTEKKVLLDPRVSEETGLEGCIRRKISLAAEAGDRLPAYLFLPKGRSRKLPAVLCLHPTNRPLGKRVVADPVAGPNMAYAAELANRGYVTLAPDYVNMGEYRFDAYSHSYVSATMKGIWNHMRCVDYLASLPEVAADRIGVIGHSLGGHNGMFLAVFDERVKCVVSSCGFCSFSRYMRGNLAGWSHTGYMPRIRSLYDCDPVKMPFDFTEVVAALAPRPFLACAPVGDTNFDVQGVRDCMTAAGPVYALLGAGDRLRSIHPDVGHDFPSAARETAYDWFDRWLKPQ